jgi:hypothetical protein
MKRILLGLMAAAVVAFGVGLTPASASTINVDPSPTDSFHVGNVFTSSTTYNDSYVFTLTHNADMTSSITAGNLTFGLGIFDPTNTLVSNNGLLAGILYTLHVAGFTGAGFSGYGGTITFTQVAATPLPPALLMFATSLVGLGAFGYRRRGAPTA